MTGIATVDIRLARSCDVPDIVTMLADDPIGRHREMPALIERYVAAYDALIADPAVQCFVATDEDGAVIGYVQMTITRHLSYCGARRALLEDLRVASHCRNNGIGGRLVETAIAAARAADCGIVQLFIHHDREEADRFYRRIGFRSDHQGFRLALS
jgi:ribosomal protein S18 acetylase RimI-like enzyme